jgi:hypothetical protein
MSTAVVVAIVVAVGEARTPTTASLLTAAREALGAAASFRVFEVSPPTDEAALTVEDDLQARAVVTIVWEDTAHLHAHTRMHVSRTDRWTDREIVFEAVDTPVERGRALGFAVASMLPDKEKAAIRAQEVAITLPPALIQKEERRSSIGFTAVGALGIGGGFDGLGGTVDLRHRLDDRLSWRGALAVRRGPAPEVDMLPAGSATAASLAAGAAWSLTRSSEATPLAVGLRADALGLYQSVTYTSTKSNFAAGLDLFGEVVAALGTGVDVVVAVGAEVVLTELDVQTEDPVTGQRTPTDQSISRFRGVGELGLRIRF